MRFKELDFAKGIGVILMIITHVNAAFYTGSNYLVDRFIWLGATVCFSIFIFSTSVVYFNRLLNHKIKIGKELKRAFKTLRVYYLLSFIMYFLYFRNDFSYEAIAELLLLLEIPIFVEFLLAFIFLGLLVVLLQISFYKGQSLFEVIRSKVRTISEAAILVFVLSLVSYFLGYYLNNNLFFQMEFLNVIKAMFVGHEDLHTFGLISYLPVILSGFLYSLIASRTTILESKNYYLKVLIVSTLGFGIVYFLYSQGLLSWKRWPPNMTFLSFGLFFVLASIGLYFNLKSSFAQKLSSLLQYIGRNILNFYILHVFILGLINYFAPNFTIENVLLIFFMYIVVITLSAIPIPKKLL